MDLAIATLSSKNQLVLPSSMCRGLHLGRGHKLLLVFKGNSIILRPISSIGKDIEEEIFLARLAQEGWEDYEKGNFKSMKKKDFLKELEKW